MPWPLEKFVARRPVMLMPAVTAAAACSPWGSKKIRRRPLTLVWPAAIAAAQPSPICVEGVIGYAPAPSLAAVSTLTTAPLPSSATGRPGYFGAASAVAFSPEVALAMIPNLAARLPGTPPPPRPPPPPGPPLRSLPAPRLPPLALERRPARRASAALAAAERPRASPKAGAALATACASHRDAQIGRA